MSHAGIRISAACLAILGAFAVPILTPNEYVLHVATLVCVYWTLVSGLSLLVGFLGQISIGHVGLLALGSYAFVIAQTRLGWSPEVALVCSGLVGGLGGLLVGAPSLRLPGFYFAMTTLAFSTMVIEVATARTDLTGGGAGTPVPGFGQPFDTPSGFYWLACSIAVFATYLCLSLAGSRWGRAMIAIRDSDVAAASLGIDITALKLAVFTSSGVLAGIAGALFGVSQSYISTESFTLDLGLFFFICVVIGGSGSLLGPLLGTAFLTVLPEAVASLSAWSALLYGVVLLVIVLVAPGGLRQVIIRLSARFRKVSPAIDVVPNLAVLRAELGRIDRS